MQGGADVIPVRAGGVERDILDLFVRQHQLVRKGAAGQCPRPGCAARPGRRTGRRCSRATSPTEKPALGRPHQQTQALERTATRRKSGFIRDAYHPQNAGGETPRRPRPYRLQAGFALGKGVPAQGIALARPAVGTGTMHGNRQGSFRHLQRGSSPSALALSLALPAAATARGQAQPSSSPAPERPPAPPEHGDPVTRGRPGRSRDPAEALDGNQPLRWRRREFPKRLAAGRALVVRADIQTGADCRLTRVYFRRLVQAPGARFGLDLAPTGLQVVRARTWTSWGSGSCPRSSAKDANGFERLAVRDRDPAALMEAARRDAVADAAAKAAASSPEAGRGSIWGICCGSKKRGGRLLPGMDAPIRRGPGSPRGRNSTMPVSARRDHRPRGQRPPWSIAIAADPGRPTDL